MEAGEDGQGYENT